MALSDAAQTSTWLVPLMLVLTVQPAWQTQRGSKYQNQRIFTPTRTPWGEKACPGLLSQSHRAVHHPLAQPLPSLGR